MNGVNDICNKGKVKEEPIDMDEMEVTSDARSVPPTFGIKNEEEEQEEEQAQAENDGYGYVIALNAKNSSEMEADMITEGREKVGTIVTKVFDGRRYMGSVVDFLADTKCFKVEYDDGYTESVEMEELEEIEVPPYLVNTYLNNARAIRREEKRARTAGTSTEENQPAREGKRRRRRGKNRKKESDYVPLAFREKKKDCYYWY